MVGTCTVFLGGARALLRELAERLEQLHRTTVLLILRVFLAATNSFVCLGKFQFRSFSFTCVCVCVCIVSFHCFVSATEITQQPLTQQYEYNRHHERCRYRPIPRSEDGDGNR
jgi:hypothetical protein